MYLSPLTSLLILLLSFFTPALTTIIIPPGVHGTAIEVSTSDARIYYQASDTSIHEIMVSGSAGSGGSVSDNVLIPAGVARTGTPLASLVIGTYTEVRVPSCLSRFLHNPSTTLSILLCSYSSTIHPSAFPNTPCAQIHLFYISTGWSGTQLCEYVYTPTNGWSNGPITAMDYTTLTNMSLLYTLSVATTPSQTYGVGFLCARGQLCEAVHTTNGWSYGYY